MKKNPSATPTSDVVATVPDHLGERFLQERLHAKIQAAHLHVPDDSLLASNFNADLLTLLNTHTDIDDVWDLLEKANALAEKEEFVQARRLVQQVLKSDPNNKTAALFLLELEEDTIKHLRRLTLMEHRWRNELSKKGLLRPAFHRDPWLDNHTKQYLELLANKVGLLIDLGRYSTALEVAQQILGLDPLDHVHIHRLAIPLTILLEKFMHAQMLITRFAEQGVDTYLVFATTLLTYKMGDYKQCAKLITSLGNANMYLISHLLASHLDVPDVAIYEPGSEEEALDVLSDFVFVLESTPSFLHFITDTLAAQNETGRCTYAQLKR